MRKYQMLQEDKMELEDKLADLYEQLKDVNSAVNTAREHGDLSENSEYEIALKNKDNLNKVIADTENILNNTEIIERAKDGSIGLGTKVRYRYTHLEGSKGEREYMIVGDGFGDILQNKISKTSPLGAALYGKTLKVNDKVKYKDNRNQDITIVILGIS